MPVYMERTIADLQRIYINGGSKGFLVGMAPADMIRLLQPIPVEVGLEG
jgi:prolyl-tRNA editing enzyme YbaK/EbsC (Cys-tRNA(Pro) deacylase)